MAHGFKVYRTKTLCRKNKHMRERERERERESNNRFETESNNRFETLSLRIGCETIR